MAAPRPITLLDVARAAGVSRTTASAALGGGGRISEATRNRVLATAERLGYAANPAARHLRRGRLGILGLYLPDQVLSLSYYMDFAFGAAERAGENRIRADPHLTVGDCEAVGGRSRRRVHHSRSDGPRCDRAQPALVRASRGYGRALPGGRTRARRGGRVRPPSRHARRARPSPRTRRAQAGIARPGRRVLVGRSLRAAYRAWCKEHGVPERLRDIAFDANAEAVHRVTSALLAEQPEPDAIISAPDGAAIGVVGAAGAAGKRVGEDLLIAACVDSVTMQLATPAITALDLRPRAFGSRCVTALIDVLDGKAVPTHHAHEIELIRRGSSGG